ncbi:MAG: aspartate aminotransferase family protein [Bryobacteraceae bacterium]
MGTLQRRKAAPEIEAGEFRELGHRLVDRIADSLAAIRRRPVTTAESPVEIRSLIGADRPLPEGSEPPAPLLEQAAAWVLEHSLFNGHPRFWGYVTSSAAPIGLLGDFLASAANANVGAWKLSPVASEMEAQTVRWIAELIGFPADCGGLLTSGGNAANFIGFLAARKAKAGWDVRKSGVASPDGMPLRLYASSETHTWVQKAADLFGLGTDAIRWVAADQAQRIDLDELRRQIDEDRGRGDRPFLVVGTAGSVSTGAVDDLPGIAAICREYGLWFHVDGAYGAVAAKVPGAPEELLGLSEADSVAVDPHKWLYAPLEAGCALVRRAEDLRNTFSYHPPYYHFDEEAINYFDYGLQNSRGFRALKVWLGLKQVGRTGYMQTIAEDIALAQHLHRLLAEHAEFQAMTQGLSITTFRYVPPDLRAKLGLEETEKYLNALNQEILTRVEKSGEAYLSNAVIDGRFALRLCIVNFRTSTEDIEALPPLVARLGREADAVLRRVLGLLT